MSIACYHLSLLVANGLAGLCNGRQALIVIMALNVFDIHLTLLMAHRENFICVQETQTRVNREWSVTHYNLLV
ncbi:hypothetical protein [Agarivorans sp. QJM3NY_33]|uniref:hypothetical protein n=1 Tax=Agarivorans sp. QJM3NY_33 TaxID=3421432 RepID=UPI003D7DA3FA